MDETGKSVGSRLIRTFGAQLGGTATVTSEAGLGTVVTLVFPDPTLKDAKPPGLRAAKAPVPAAFLTKCMAFCRRLSYMSPATMERRPREVVDFVSGRATKNEGGIGHGGYIRRGGDRRRPGRL